MGRVEVSVECPVFDSFRVRQVGGMFDVPLAERARRSFAVDVPGVDESWTIGLITGPSASGKSTVARQAFGGALAEPAPWPRDRAVIDCLGEGTVRALTGLLTAVGLGSPPAWVRPYHVLSGGERFRSDLARALAVGLNPVAQAGGMPPLVVFDEFTSVVDRNVAKVASAAISRALRGGRIACRFVAVTCHYDVARWLEPDWVVDMADCSCTRRRLRRPAIELALHRVRRRLWSAFAPHHYLSGALTRAARCYAAFFRGVAVAFCATIPLVGRRNHWRVTRIVTLPDYQGIGIGTSLLEAVCQVHRQQQHRINITASHPAIVEHCRRSRRWRAVQVLKTGAPAVRRIVANYRASRGRSVASFEYSG